MQELHSIHRKFESNACKMAHTSNHGSLQHMFRLESTHTMPAIGARTGYDDVPGNCQGSTVDECKAMCLSTQGCGGFNYPHGVRES